MSQRPRLDVLWRHEQKGKPAGRLCPGFAASCLARTVVPWCPGLVDKGLKKGERTLKLRRCRAECLKPRHLAEELHQRLQLGMVMEIWEELVGDEPLDIEAAGPGSTKAVDNEACRWIWSSTGRSSAHCIRPKPFSMLRRSQRLRSVLEMRCIFCTVRRGDFRSQQFIFAIKVPLDRFGIVADVD